MSGVTPEGKVKKKVKTCLELLGAYYAMPVASGFGNAGVPDFLVCYKGRYIAIETKANGGKPTALQLKNLDQIIEAGGIAWIVDENNVGNLKELIMETVK